VRCGQEVMHDAFKELDNAEFYLKEAIIAVSSASECYKKANKQWDPIRWVYFLNDALRFIEQARSSREG